METVGAADTGWVLDSGWALVIGAAIALVGSAVVPWIRESVHERSQAVRTRRAEVAAALAGFGNALTDASHAMIAPSVEGMKGIATAWAMLLELELLLQPDEKDIATIGREALRATFNKVEKPILMAYAEAVASWHRDGTTPAAALARFRSLLNDSPTSSTSAPQ